MDNQDKYHLLIQYIRRKTDQILTLMGTLPLRPEELDDDTLLELDPIGIVSESFRQVLTNLNETNHKLNLAHSEIQVILDTLQAAVVVGRLDGTLEDCNQVARDWFFGGREKAQLVGQPFAEVCSCTSSLAEMRRQISQQQGELLRDGRHLLVNLSDILDEHGGIDKTVILFFDITALKKAEANLQLYASVFSQTQEGILITDQDQRIIEVNDALCRITGYDKAELLGKTPHVLRSGRHDEAFYEAMWRTLHEAGSWRGELFDRTKDGQVIPLLENISVIRDAQGRVTHYISVITDITTLKETQERLDHLAHHDVLTELPNRLLFRDRLEQATERARRDGTQFGLLFIDLDRFKNINDSLGHHIGDLLLIQVGERLRGLVRRADTVARLGGDEFVVLTERLNLDEDATVLAQKIIAAIQQPFDIGGHDLHIGCSIGITLFPEDGLDSTVLLKNADTSMYRAKEAGRDCYYRFTAALSADVDSKLDLENALRAAVREEAFVLHYQPIIGLSTGRVLAAEALIRWPGRAGATPDRFIPVAEETRLIIPLSEWILRKSMQQFQRWRDAGLSLDFISVNISAVHLAQPNFADRLLAQMRECAFEGRHLQLELTENLLMRDMKMCQRVLEQLRTYGIRVAIDDFGTGYSSLAYLKQLPIDNLKIDRSFVRDIPGDPNDCAIAGAIIGLARTLGLKSVAEGIETEEQRDYLTKIGCDKVQGYLYSRPLPPDEFLQRCHTLMAGPAGDR